MANSPSGESVIGRVTRLLAAFGPDTPTMPLRRLAREVDLPVATAHRLLVELEAEGLMVRGSDGQWRHGTRLWEIASRGARVAELREVALPYLEDVFHAVQAHVSLGVMDGNDVLYLERLDRDDDTVNITRTAGRLPAYACSAGLIFYAYGPAERREILLRRRLEAFTDHTITDPVRLRRIFDRARRDGYLCVSRLIVPESSGISVPVFDRAGEVTATLTVIVPAGEERLPVIVPQLTLAGRSISRRLGYDPRVRGVLRRSLPAPR